MARIRNYGCSFDHYAKAPRKNDVRPGHVLLGVLLADVGTVPRALALAGVDPGRVGEAWRA